MVRVVATLRCASRDGLFPAKVGRCARDRVAVAPDRSRRRHDACPGKALLRLAPDAIERLAARLPDGVVIVSATNGKTTTLGAGRGGPRARRTSCAATARGANLLSGVAATLLTALGRRAARAARGGRVRAARGRPPHATARAAARQPVPRPARPLRRAGAGGRALARRWSPRCRPRRCWWSAPTTRSVGVLGDGRANVIRVRPRRPVGRAPRPRRRGRLDHLRALRPRLRLRGDLPRPPRRLPLPALRLRPAAARHRRHRESACDGVEGAASARRAGRHARRRARPAGHLQRRQRRSARSPWATALGVAPAAAATRLGGFAGGVRPLRAGRRRRPRRRAAAGQEPGRRQRGAAHACATPTCDGAVLLLALNDRIADGRDVSWIWDVDFEEALPARRARRLQRHPRRRHRAARQATPACPPTASRSSRTAPPPSTARLELAGAGGTAYVLPTYTAMLELQRLVRPSAAWRGPTGRRRRVITIVPLYPELLSIYADRGNVRVLEQRCALARASTSRCSRWRFGDDLDPDRADVILIGGGQDRDQVLVADELLRQTPLIREALAEGAALLAVCGGYQLLGHRYRGHQGDEIPGTGLVDLETRRRRHAHHRQRAGRLPLRRRAAHDGRVREPRRAHVARRRRRSRSAGSSRAAATTARTAPRAAAPGASSAPTCTGRCCRRTRWLADALLGLGARPARRSRRRWRRWTTRSRRCAAERRGRRSPAPSAGRLAGHADLHPPLDAVRRGRRDAEEATRAACSRSTPRSRRWARGSSTSGRCSARTTS